MAKDHIGKTVSLATLGVGSGCGKVVDYGAGRVILRPLGVPSFYVSIESLYDLGIEDVYSGQRIRLSSKGASPLGLPSEGAYTVKFPRSNLFGGKNVCLTPEVPNISVAIELYAQKYGYPDGKTHKRPLDEGGSRHTQIGSRFFKKRNK